MAVVAKQVNASDCGSDIRGFEPRRSPHRKNKELRFLFLFQPKSSKRDETAYIMRVVRIAHKVHVNIYI